VRTAVISLPRLLFGDGDSLEVVGSGLEVDVTRPERVLQRLRLDAETSPRDVAGFLGSQAGGLVGGLLGDLAVGELPGGGGGERVPLRIRAGVQSRDGDVKVTSVSGSVAGVPAGPLAEVVVGSVVREL
jgi:hypothetical protein